MVLIMYVVGGQLFLSSSEMNSGKWSAFDQDYPIDRCFTDGTGAAWPGHPEFVAQLMALLGIRVSF